MRRFYEGVCSIPGVTVYGDFETEKRAPVVSLNILDYDSSEVSDELSMEYGIVTRPGGALRAFDAPRAGDCGAGSGAVQFFLL